MTEADIKERAQQYIDEALAETTETIAPDERDVAIKRVEAASRELLAVSSGGASRARVAA